MSRTLKISSLDQAEEHINRQNNQIRNLESRLSGISSRAAQEARQETELRVNELRSEMEDMFDQFSSQVNGLEKGMAKMERDHWQSLQEQTAEFHRHLFELSEWTENSIGQLEENVKKGFKKHEQHIEEQKERLDHLYEKEANDTRIANQMVKDVQILVRVIGDRANHRKFAEGRWDQLNNRVTKLLKANIPSQAVISDARQIANELFEMEENVLMARLKFEAIYILVLNQATTLLKTMNKNRNELYYTDEKGEMIRDDNNEGIKMEIDFWTMNEYKILEERTEALQSELEAGKDAPALNEERLKQILQEINNINTRHDELIKIALKRGIASEERVKISEDIINALMEQGYYLDKMANGEPAHNYMKGEIEADQREGVFAVLKNGVGSEISVIVHPDENLTKNHIVFQRNDNSNLTQDELRRSIEEIRRVIEGKGYKMGNVASPAGTGDNRQPELADANALAKVGLKKELKKRLGFY